MASVSKTLTILAAPWVGWKMNVCEECVQKLSGWSEMVYSL